jgi:hypothetical protein
VRNVRAAALAILLAAGCGHARKPPPSQPSDAAARQAPAPAGGAGEPDAAEKGVPPEGDRPRVPASPDALLAEGAVAEIQEALVARGYLARHRKGVLDDATTAALRRHQREEGLAETGFPDRETVRRLGIDPEEAYGRVREEVKGEGK